MALLWVPMTVAIAHAAVAIRTLCGSDKIRLRRYLRARLIRKLNLPSPHPISDPLALLACLAGCDFVKSSTSGYLQARVDQVNRAGARRQRGASRSSARLKLGLSDWPSVTPLVARPACGIEWSHCPIVVAAMPGPT